jgi:hypothetical protein
MPEMLFVQDVTTPSALLNGLDQRTSDDLCRVNNSTSGAFLQSGSIFSLDDDVRAANIRAQLNYLPAPERQCIGNITKMCGSETLALSAFLDRYFSLENIQIMNAVINASSTTAGARLNGFETAVVNYQKALNGLRGLAASGNHGRGHTAAIQKAKALVKETYADLGRRYGVELQKFAPEALRGKNRGNAFSNAERGITLAQRNLNSPKPDVRLNVESQLQASQLARMGKLINGLGNMTIAVDGAFRVVKVMDIEAEGGDWMREGAKEVTGFGLGTATGIFAATGAYSGLLALAGPVGWGLLGAIFLVSFGAGMLGSYAGNEFGQQISTFLMDTL